MEETHEGNLTEVYMEPLEVLNLLSSFEDHEGMKPPIKEGSWKSFVLKQGKPPHHIFLTAELIEEGKWAHHYLVRFADGATSMQEGVV